MRGFEMEQKILELINDAEMVLIGIGTEFSPQTPQYDTLEAYRRSSYYEELPDDCEQIRAYNKLRSLVGAKPYFVVTLNTDDLVYRSAFEDDLIVAPCGSMAKLQCGEHIVEADEIRRSVLNAGDERLAVCPECGKPLQFHTIEAENYMEQGYLPTWEKYKKWLQCTLNRRLCILELGVGFQYPQVIRWPFEKIAMYNQKAHLIRVSAKFPQLAEKLSQKGVSVPEHPVQFLLKAGDESEKKLQMDG